jgi:hypothetical protein
MLLTKIWDWSEMVEELLLFPGCAICEQVLFENFGHVVLK